MVEVKARSLLPSTMILCSQTRQMRRGVMGEPPAGGYGSWGLSPTSRAWGKLPHGNDGKSICLRNTTFLSSRADQETWDLLATKE